MTLHLILLARVKQRIKILQPPGRIDRRKFLYERLGKVVMNISIYLRQSIRFTYSQTLTFCELSVSFNLSLNNLSCVFSIIDFLRLRYFIAALRNLCVRLLKKKTKKSSFLEK